MGGLTYINGTCRVGQVEPCGEPAVHVIAVVSVADTAWAEDGRDGGVVGLCAFHAGTAVVDWDAPAAQATDAGEGGGDE